MLEKFKSLHNIHSFNCNTIKINPSKYKNHIIMSVGPVSIQINVWVNIIEYIPIPTPFLANVILYI